MRREGLNILPLAEGEGDREAVEGASAAANLQACAPPPSRRDAPRHLPRFAGEEMSRRVIAREFAHG
jgi:hypothetical protein